MGRVDHEVIHPSAAGPALTLHVQVGFGSVAITTATAPDSATPKSAVPVPPIPAKVPVPAGPGGAGGAG
jgi:hypothetical protein